MKASSWTKQLGIAVAILLAVAPVVATTLSAVAAPSLSNVTDEEWDKTTL
ncbi:hypothetical protein [Schleiferilactobacillus harbinensis]|jgi:hypothetical protein|nr:hypothetical protein [Schleiferilactobacillus harbinensis]MCI1686514.1 hypothetical protein [Schleiferilactobacillus harbinensis]MCI1782825.1 hypothetical protein [Schleiferilactobacillus harbinensis]MCI1850800.1 hypothetical protein [Schleiferilactobacillus harbinensis]